EIGSLSGCSSMNSFRRNEMSVTAFAPATVANVAVGFDLLGFPIEGAGDWVTVSLSPEREVVIDSILDRDQSVAGKPSSLPLDPASNTATAGLLMMIQELKLDFGFRVKIRKGIPMGSGM